MSQDDMADLTKNLRNFLIEHHEDYLSAQWLLAQEDVTAENRGFARDFIDLYEKRVIKYRKAMVIVPLFYGILSLVIGAAISLFTYAAAQGGGYYVITTGVFLFGAYNLFRALLNASHLRRPLKGFDPNQ